MRIGLFGGTFNPIHRGHIKVVQEVKKGFNLEQVFIIPAALPPHKTSFAVAGADDRLKMIHLALADLSGITVSEVELKRAGPSYTIDTVSHFKQTYPHDSLFYLILGLDAFLEIDTWKSYRQLLEQTALIVVARPNEKYQKGPEARKIMEGFLQSSIAADYEFSAPQGCFVAAGKQPIYIRDISALDISSTEIREKIKKHKSIENLVSPSVAEYIHLKGLYK